jgi:hypothetical protein
VNLTAASDQKLLRRGWGLSRAGIACVMVFLAAGRTAYATSQCLQWRVSSGSPSTTTDWMTSAPQACSTYVGLCAANPAGCGYNTVNYEYRNWGGNAVLSSGGWPVFRCNVSEASGKTSPGSGL